LERCAHVLDNDATVVLCHTDKARIDAQGQILGYLRQQGDPHANRCKDGTQTYSEQISRGRESSKVHERFRTVLLGPSYCLDCFGLLRASELRRTRLILPFFGSEKVLSAEISLLGRVHRIREVLFYLRQHGGELERDQSAEQQEVYVGTANARKLPLTRFKLLWGHLSAVWRAPISMTDRGRCYAAVLAYVLQLRKWRRILTETLTRAPINSGERHTLVPLAEPLTIGQILRSAPESPPHPGGGGAPRQ
jgi:hypothetical protein